MRVSRAFLAMAFAIASHAADPLMDEYNRAWQLVGRGKAGQAIPLLEGIIAKAPQFWRAYSGLVEASRQQNTLDRAEAYLQGLLKEDPARVGAIFGLGWLYNHQRRFDRAVTRFAACARAEAPIPPCYTQLAQSLAERHKRLASFVDLRRVLPGGEDHPYRCLAHVNLHLTRRRLAEAVPPAQACLRRAEALGDADLLAEAQSLLASAYGGTFAGVETLRESLATSERLQDWGAVLGRTINLADWIAELGRPHEAVDLLQSGLRRAREFGNRDASASLLRSLASHAARTGDPDRALRFGWQAHKDFVENERWTSAADTLLWLGGIHQRRGEISEALRLYRDSVLLARREGIRETEAFGLRAIGVAYMAAGDYFQALRYGGESLALFRRLDDQ
ncbi:MAG: tetratricopeptide repeat protein, partial [Bryobacteraceae bacterium]